MIATRPRLFVPVLAVLTVAAVLLAVGVWVYVFTRQPATASAAPTTPAIGAAPATEPAKPDNKEPVAPPNQFMAVKPGDTLVVLVNRDEQTLPAPFLGIPVAKERADIATAGRVGKDVARWMQRADGERVLFCRVGSKVKVLKSEMVDRDEWAEVEFLTGANSGKTGWVPAEFLGQWKAPADLDKEKWPEAKRRRVHVLYFETLQKSLSAGARTADGKGRFAAEEQAAKDFVVRKEKFMDDEGVDFDSDLLAIVLTELATGRDVPFADR